MLKLKLFKFINPLYFVVVILILTLQQCNFKNSHLSGKSSDPFINQKLLSSRSNISDLTSSYSKNISPIRVSIENKSVGNVSLQKNKKNERIENRNFIKTKRSEIIDTKLTLKEVKKEIRKENPKKERKGKNQLVALLLLLFLGVYGVHRFYLGYTLIGIIQILTLGGLFIWTIIDLVRVIRGTLKPKNGEYEKKL